MLLHAIKDLIHRQRWQYREECARRDGHGLRFNHEGTEYSINPDYSAIFHIENSTKKIQRLVDLLPENTKVVVDLGANCGLFSAFALKRFPKAESICVEPARDLHQYIKSNCKGNISLFECAISDSDGVADFYVNSFSQQTNSLLKEAVEPFLVGNNATRTRVKTRKLDGIVAELKIDEIDAIKIDIQGGEAAALKGSSETLKKTEMIFIESTWLDIGSILGISKFARANGFKHIGVVNIVNGGADVALSKSPFEKNEHILSFVNLDEIMDEWV
jgi:FkbM family methyltransferase